MSYTPEKMEQANENGNGTAFKHDENSLNRLQTAGSVAMSPEMFEKLYLTPLTNVKGDLRKTFGNPTPM